MFFLYILHIPLTTIYIPNWSYISAVVISNLYRLFCFKLFIVNHLLSFSNCFYLYKCYSLFCSQNLLFCLDTLFSSIFYPFRIENYQGMGWNSSYNRVLEQLNVTQNSPKLCLKLTRQGTICISPCTSFGGAIMLKN